MTDNYKNIIVHTADVHFSKEHYEDIIGPFLEFLEYVKEVKPKYTVISGDYYDKIIENSNPIYMETINYLLDLSYYTKHLIILRGTLSHDYYNLNILKTINKLKPNIYFFDKKTDIRIGDYDFLMLPEEYHDNMEEYYNDIYKSKYDFIIGHGMLNGAKLHNGIDNTKLKTFMFYVKKLETQTKYWVLFGHIHIPQKLGEKTYYCGSLARYKYGEEEDKGFRVYDIDNNKTEFIKIKNISEYKTILEKDLEELSEIDILEKLKNQNIRYKGDKDNPKLREYLEKLQKNLKEIKIITTTKEENILEFIDSKLLHKSIENKTKEEQFLEILEKDLEKTKRKSDKEKLKLISMTDKIKELTTNYNEGFLNAKQ